MFPEPLCVAAEICPAIYEYYGMHETGTLTLSTPEDRKLHPDSIGVPLLFAEVRIERPDGSIAAPGEIGEIVGRSTATCTVRRPSFGSRHRQRQSLSCSPAITPHSIISIGSGRLAV
jgi:acyl-CoA synthetase (AMP-forming)/AMP-acid ligase II